MYEVKYLSGGARHAPLFSGEHFLSHLFHSVHLSRLSLSFSICHSFSCLIGLSNSASLDNILSANTLWRRARIWFQPLRININ